MIPKASDTKARATVAAGINGFGRFGLHLLKYWLDRNKDLRFRIAWINDDTLDLASAFRIITSDPRVSFHKYKVATTDGALVILEPDGSRHSIAYTHLPAAEITRHWQADILFECSGKNTEAANCRRFLDGRTSLVLVSATSWDCDQTLIFGFNHGDFTPASQVVSYGSCTVNAYVPVAVFLNKTVGVENCDVNVIHNIQPYRLADNNTLLRKFCTLERSGPALLPWLGAHNFVVNYTVIPYAGVSIMDFRFGLKREMDRSAFIELLEEAIHKGELRNLYGIDEIDIGPEVYNCTTYSAVFIKNSIRVAGRSVYLQAYFDNENSVNRYCDLADYLAGRIGEGALPATHGA